MHVHLLSCFSCVQVFVTPWTIACQVPLSMEFSRQEYWSGWPFPSPGDLPDPGIKTRAPALQADSLPIELPPAIFIKDHQELFCVSVIPAEKLSRPGRPLIFCGRCFQEVSEFWVKSSDQPGMWAGGSGDSVSELGTWSYNQRWFAGSWRKERSSAKPWCKLERRYPS